MQRAGLMNDTNIEDTPGMPTLCYPSFPVPPAGLVPEPQLFDSVKLNQRLDSLLLDLQTGNEQLKSIWQVWHDPEDDQPTVLLDKPQTAPPPASPSEKMFESGDEKAYVSQNWDINEDIAELISNQMSLAPFIDKHDLPLGKP